MPSYGQNFGVRGNTMRVQMQRSGLLTATLGLIAQGENKLTASAAGTPAEASIERFSPFQGAITRGGVALASSPRPTSRTYSNQLEKVETIRGDGRIEDADPGMVMMSGSITTRFRDTALLDQATAGDPVALTLRLITDAARSLVFEVPAVYLPRAKTPVTGPNGVQATFNWQAAKDSVSPARPSSPPCATTSPPTEASDAEARPAPTSRSGSTFSRAFASGCAPSRSHPCSSPARPSERSIATRTKTDLTARAAWRWSANSRIAVSGRWSGRASAPPRASRPR
ncbi:phage tail tube protein [Methylorubrum extorquens]